MSIAFRLPEEEDLEAFEARLRATGLVGGKFEVLPRAADAFWEQCVGILNRSVYIRKCFGSCR